MSGQVSGFSFSRTSHSRLSDTWSSARSKQARRMMGFRGSGLSNVFYAFCPIVGSATDIAEWSGPRPDRDGSAHPKHGRKR